MNSFSISVDELKSAQDFFSGSDIDVLTSQSIKINKKQPNFTAVVLALEMLGLNRFKVEDLLESIFVVYFAQTELRKKSIATISSGQVKKNIEKFGEFISYFNDERKEGSHDLSEIKFLRDNTVLEFALKTLHKIFGDLAEIPDEVTFSYFAILKAIEIGAEKTQ